MSKMINFSGKRLQRDYDTKLESNIKSDAEKTQEQKDREALRKHA